VRMPGSATRTRRQRGGATGGRTPGGDSR
jgi:hypothetical protein